MLGAVEWGIYPYISMSMLLLFTRIRRANVDSYAIVFKSLSFAPFTLKRGLQRFQKVSVFDRRNRSKSYAF